MANILVCDDDKEIVDAIEIYLSQDGYKIYKAYDGEQAIQILDKEEIHLLIMDIMMPKLDGIRATLKIREYSSIPIIILSAKSCKIVPPKATLMTCMPLQIPMTGIPAAIAMSRAWNCRMSSSVSTVREPLFFSPKKAGVISPPPGRIRASQAHFILLERRLRHSFLLTSGN